MVEFIALILAVALAVTGYLYWQLRTTIQEAESRLKTDLKTREERVAELLDQIETKNDMIATLKETVTEKQSMIETTEQRLKDRTSKVKKYEADLAEAKRTEVYKEALLLTLANSAYDSLIIADKDLKIIAINTRAEQLFNCRDAVGKMLSEVTDMPELEMIVQDALRNEEEVFEEQIKLGASYYRIRSSVMRRDGHFFIGIALQDITVLVRLNRARRDMVANISHELRHPIANIRLTIDSLFHDQDKPKRKDSISSLRAIAHETDNLMWLVQEMSDLAMIESGQSIVRMVDVSLPELIDEAIERINDQSAMKEVTIVKHIPAKLRVLCDRDLAQRVIVNLVHNAIKWSPEDETITLSAFAENDEVTISVLDNGPGVPPEKVDRIFERFYQVDDSRSRGEGTGLGLAICKHIVEAHGGRIWAEGNLKGAGGRFLFTLMSAEDEEVEVVEEES